MKSYFWNEESFGTDCPSNWEEIAAAVNEHLEDYQAVNDADDDEMQSHSDRLWEQFCESNEVCGVEGVYTWYAYQETEDEREEGAWDCGGTTSKAEALNWLREQYESGNEAAEVAVLDTDREGMATLCTGILTTDDI